MVPIPVWIQYQYGSNTSMDPIPVWIQQEDPGIQYRRPVPKLEKKYRYSRAELQLSVLHVHGHSRVMLHAACTRHTQATVTLPTVPMTSE